MTSDPSTRGCVIRLKRITREIVRKRPGDMFVFGDNMARSGMKGQAAAMRGEPNAIGVPTKWTPSTKPRAYFTDADADNPKVRFAIVDAFNRMRVALAEGRNVVIPADGLGTGLAELPTRAPRIHLAIERRIAALETEA